MRPHSVCPLLLPLASYVHPAHLAPISPLPALWVPCSSSLPTIQLQTPGPWFRGSKSIRKPSGSESLRPLLILAVAGIPSISALNPTSRHHPICFSQLQPANCPHLPGDSFLTLPPSYPPEPSPSCHPSTVDQRDSAHGPFLQEAFLPTLPLPPTPSCPPLNELRPLLLGEQRPGPL